MESVNIITNPEAGTARQVVLDEAVLRCSRGDGAHVQSDEPFSVAQKEAPF